MLDIGVRLNTHISLDGGIGRHTALKKLYPYGCASSSLARGTNLFWFVLFLFVYSTVRENSTVFIYLRTISHDNKRENSNRLRY